MKWLVRVVKLTFVLGTLGALLAVGLIGGAYYYLEPQLPSIENLRDVRLQVPLRVYSADGGLIAEFGEKRRIPLGFEQFPERLVQAYLAAEDASFFSHPGVDVKGLIRAGTQLLLTGERRQGGSTITMQVARNFYLTREKTFTRKLNEIFLALRIEQELSKQEILELYLNKIYLGHRAYGVGAAAQVYYGKTVDELDLAEMAMVAGLPKAPSRFNPVTDPERALQRRNYVLGRMHELGQIDAAELRAAVAAPVTARLHTAETEVEAPYVAEMVRAQLLEQYGEDTYTNGYRVYTTLDGRLQAAANTALRDALEDYDRRHGYRGPEGQLEAVPGTAEERAALLAGRDTVGPLLPGIVLAVDARAAQVEVKGEGTVTLPWEGLDWARRYVNEDVMRAAPKQAADVLAVGDLVRVRAETDKEGKVRWRLAQVPEVAGALVSLRPDDGAVVALVGGYDFYRSKFNRAVQARRQPGSGFKAFIYSAALEAGFSTASLVNDAPVVLTDASLEGDWRPENYSGKFFGPTRLRYALTKSRNLVSIRLLRSMGIEHALEHIGRFGFDTGQLPRNLSLALGSGAVTPLEMARGYAVLANGGFLVEPHLVQRIEEDGKGVVFEATPRRACPQCAEPAVAEAPTPDAAADADADADAPPGPAPRVISPQNRYLMYSMMQDVITAGTATKARSLGRKDLAGKTGTTNEQRDAWFNGYNQHLVAVAWVGFDSNDKLGRGEVGGRAALPAWIDYMRVALADLPDEPPQMPPDLVTVRIDADTGQRASPGTGNAIFEVFRTAEVPGENAAATTAAPIGGRRGSPAAPPPVDELF